MTVVSQYYAEVGVGVNRRSLESVKSYLNNIESMLESFKRRVERKQTINVKVKANTDGFTSSLQKATNRIARSVSVPLSKFTVNEKNLARALSKAVSSANVLNAIKSQPKADNTNLANSLQRSLNKVAGAVVIPLKKFEVNDKALARAMNRAISSVQFSRDVRFGAMLSRQSLVGMRTQIRQALEGTIIKPKIQPTVLGGKGSGSGGRGFDGITTTDPTNTRRMSPWHNPMMVGGGLGAFLRYGMFSLPLIGGAVGLNALNRFGSTHTAQTTALSMVSDMSTTGTTLKDNQDFLKGLTAEIGKTSMGMAPIYTQMLAASNGTKLEAQMPEMFSGIMKYASVMGLGEESIKRAMTGFQQMIGKRQIMAEELKGQVGEHIPTVIPLMAKAMNVSVKELFDIMQKGQLDPMTALPKLAKLMSEMSAPAMAAYQKSLPYYQGRAEEMRQEYGRKFLEGGGQSGLTRFWRVSQQAIINTMGTAGDLGKVFETLSYKMTSFLLLPGELKRWADGEKDIRNFFQKTFGNFADNPQMQRIVQNFRDLSGAIAPLAQSILSLAGNIAGKLSPAIIALGNIGSSVALAIVRGAEQAASVLDALMDGDIDKAKAIMKDNQMKRLAEYRTKKEFEAAGFETTGRLYEHSVAEEYNTMKLHDKLGMDSSTYMEKLAEYGKAQYGGSRSELVNSIVDGTFYKKIRDAFSKPVVVPENGATYSHVANSLAAKLAKSREIPVLASGAITSSPRPIQPVEPVMNIPKDDYNTQYGKIEKHQSIDIGMSNNVTITVNAMGTTTEVARDISNKIAQALDVQMGKVLEEVNATIPKVAE